MGDSKVLGSRSCDGEVILRSKDVGRWIWENYRKKSGQKKSALKEELELSEPERRVLQFLFLYLAGFSWP